MNDYPPRSVSFDVRFTLPAECLPGFVQIVEELPEGFGYLEDVEFIASPIVFGGSPHDPQLQEAFERRCD
jgi:hypothetical protein